MTDPYLLVAVQLLDGLTAAVMSVMVPLTIADLTRGSGRFNLTQGVVGTMMGLGASISPTFAGYMSDTFGSPAAFMGLAVVAMFAVATVWFLMPETRPAAATFVRILQTLDVDLLHRRHRLHDPVGALLRA